MLSSRCSSSGLLTSTSISGGGRTRRRLARCFCTEGVNLPPAAAVEVEVAVEVGLVQAGAALGTLPTGAVSLFSNLDSAPVLPVL